MPVAGPGTHLTLAIPADAYPRKVADRSLPGLATKAAHSVAVQGLVVEDHELHWSIAEEDVDKAPLSVSLVRVTASFTASLTTAPAAGMETVPFGELEGQVLYPSAAALVAAVDEKLVRGTTVGPKSAGGVRLAKAAGRPAGEAVRAPPVAKEMAELQATLASLRAEVTALKEGAPATPRVLPQVPSKAKISAGVPDVDPLILAEAAAAGIPASEVLAVASMIQRRPGRPQSEPKLQPRPKQVKSVLSDSEGEAEAEPAKGSAMEQAVLALTKISTRLVERIPASSSDPLERALGGLTGASLSESGMAGRRGAAAYPLLEAALVDRPEAISAPMIKNMLDQCRNSVAPPREGELPDPLRWLQDRSMVSGHRTNVNWAWIVGHICKALLAKKSEEALARSLLALAAAETISLENGSWLMAQELQFTQEPPYSAFDAHDPSQSRVRYSKLIDPRWAEVVLAKLKEMDEMVDRRAKLRDHGTVQVGKPPWLKAKEQREAETGGKAKGHGKGKDKGAKTGEE